MADIKQNRLKEYVKNHFERNQAFDLANSLLKKYNLDHVISKGFTISDFLEATNDAYTDILLLRKKPKPLTPQFFDKEVKGGKGKTTIGKQISKFLNSNDFRIKMRNLSPDEIKEMEKTSKGVDWKEFKIPTNADEMGKPAISIVNKIEVTKLLYYLITIKQILSLDELKKVSTIELAKQFRISTGIDLSHQYWDQKLKTSFHPDVKNRNKGKKMAKMEKDLALKYKDL